MWTLYTAQKAAGAVDPDVSSRRKFSGNKRPEDELQERMQDIPLRNRTTVRGLAAQLGMAASTLLDNLKHLGLRVCRRLVRPFLTERNKQGRLQWAKRWVQPHANDEKALHHFEDFVHVDEKYFVLCQDGQKY